MSEVVEDALQAKIEALQFAVDVGLRALDAVRRSSEWPTMEAETQDSVDRAKIILSAPELR